MTNKNMKYIKQDIPWWTRYDIIEN